jgi:type IV pilus assembly protein PilA
MMKMRRNTKGFTLIELLIVVAIIGILAAIAIPAYSGYTTKAKVAGVVHAIGAVKTSIAAYHTEAGGATVPVAATAAVIGATFGVAPPTVYALFDDIVAGANTITLTPDTAFSRWTWGGTIPVAYQPKS